MWIEDKYYYSKGTLKAIAENYYSIYEGLPLLWNHLIHHPLALAEYKADFDIALGKLSSMEREVVKAFIDGVDDYDLERRIYRPQALRARAFNRMKKCLNG